jgi:hypothetical protein
MTKLLLILFCLCGSLVNAQQLSKKKVDPKTRDTTQYTREQSLYNPANNYIFNLNNFIGWRIEKISAKDNGGDTILLYLRIDPGKYFQLTRDSSLLHITFAGGHSLNLTASSVEKYLYTSGETSPKHGNTDIFAAYPLTAADILQLTTQFITSLRIHTTTGPVDYSIKHGNALKIQKVFQWVTKSKL